MHVSTLVYTCTYTGLQAVQGVYHHSGSDEVYVPGLLEDDL